MILKDDSKNAILLLINLSTALVNVERHTVGNRVMQMSNIHDKKSCNKMKRVIRENK